MAYLTIPAYEANMPFIYAYYAEDDTRSALPILTRLYNEGLRMWSWNGCAHPSDFRATQRINSCTALIIFLSDNLNRAVDRGEFEALAALRCNKVKYFIRLSDVQLPFDWGRSDTNIIIDYVRSNEAAFWLNIYDSTLIEKCRGPWPEQPLSGELPSLDEFYAEDINDEYSALSKIIDNVPRVDRYGAPVNAEDISLFAGVGDEDEPRSAPEPQENDETVIPPSIDELNQSSMEDLLSMLDDISLSTRARAEAIEEENRRRAAEQLLAAGRPVSLPFEQANVPVEDTAEPPVPAISFGENANLVELAARDMFGTVACDDAPEEPKEDSTENEAKKLDTAEIVINEPETQESFEEAEEEEPSEPQLSLEQFIDDLVGLPPLSDDISDIAAPVAPQYEAEPEQVNSGSRKLPDIVLPDDKETDTDYIYHINYEGDVLPTAEERAQQARHDRQEFERAVNHAAFKVTGQLVAKPVTRRKVGLKVRKQTIVRIDAKIKSVPQPPEPPAPQSLILKVKAAEKPTPVKKRAHRLERPVSEPVPAQAPAPMPVPPVADTAAAEEAATSKRRFSHKPAAEPKSAAASETPAAPDTQEPAPPAVSRRRHSHRPKEEPNAQNAAVLEPVAETAPEKPAKVKAEKQEKPKMQEKPKKEEVPASTAPEAPEAPKTEDTVEGEEPAVSKRKKKFPHSASSALSLLRELRHQQRSAQIVLDDDDDEED